MNRAPTGYTITAPLAYGGRSILYRAVRSEDRRPVILKVLDPRHSRPRDVERLEHEHAIGETLDLETVVKTLDLVTYQRMPALVLEDFGGESLDHFLGSPLPIERFLELAVRIAAAVAELHDHSIVHKDLKPENILVHPTTGHVKLGDLGLASRLPREHQAPGSPSLIEGSLPYLSPEQTGRMNRAIDSRADLYALGVTFYQMLTGRLPFEAHDPLEWVHCHVARAPPPPTTIVSELPEVLSAIVQKLLAKRAEDRYQTARGLEHDLGRCLSAWRGEGRIEPFPLAEHDVSERFQIPEKLYGREGEVAALLAVFERVVATGSPELVLVSGYSGIGKSALVNELHKPIVRERGFFISGKFDQYTRDIPYSMLVQAFRELVLAILAEREDRMAEWRERLLAALGINAQLIVDVIREVELVIGPQPPAPELPPAEAQNRFRMVFRRFIGVFAQEEHPLALFLDDLQWADSASLGLLQELVAHPEMHHLLLIGAYRGNEVTPAHPLMLTLTKVREAEARVSDIVLGPIPREHLAELVGDTLHCGREEASPLAELVHEKTAGNPFFAIQFLTALHEEGLIAFDGRAGLFRWDVAKIRRKGFTHNVVDLMVGKLARLPERAQETLKQLACLGNSAEVSLLAMVHGGPEEDTHRDLWEAACAGLVLRLDDTYKFAHDRIREAVYSQIPEDRRAEAHLAIGRLLSSRLPEDAIAARVFEVANQWNKGAHLLADPREKETLHRLDALAGRKARTAIAYASAESYLAQAAALLPKDAWDTRYEETFALYLELAECEYLVGNFQRADELFELLLSRARRDIDKARAYRLRMQLYQVAGRYHDAVTVMLDALRLFGVTLPPGDQELQAVVEAEIDEVPIHLRGRPVEGLALLPMCSDESIRIFIGLLVGALSPAYIARPLLWPLVSVKALNLSLQYGNTRESAVAYAAHAIMQVSILDDIPRALQFSETALRLNERLDDAAHRGQVLLIHASSVNVWCRHFATSVPILEQAFLACLDVGDLVWAGFITFNVTWLHLESGDSLDHVIEVSRRYAAFARQSHNDVIHDLLRIEEQFAASLKGTTRAPTSFDDGAFDEAECIAALKSASFGLGLAYHEVMKQIAAFLHERYAEAQDAADRAATMLPTIRAMSIEATHSFYRALTLTALHAGAPPEEQRRFDEIIEEQLRRLKLWADNCPENFRNRHALVSAEVARIHGREADAMRLYEEAIRSARDNGFVQNEALAYELASRFYRARGLDLFADTYLREARARYARWGADGKVKQIDQQHPHLFEPRHAPPTATFAAPTVELDLLSVTKASQTISGELVLDELLRTLLKVVLEQGGATRACLVLCRDEIPSIEAEATLEANGAIATVLEPMPVRASPHIPASVVHYALRTKRHVILSDAAADPGKFAGDDYFARRRSKAVLCLPILRQAEVIGLLYLENDLLAGAFTPDRLLALSLCATQAAISLENALLLRRAAFLAEAGEILSASLDYRDTLSRLGRLCVRWLCDWCVIDVVEGGEIQRVSGAHKDPAKEQLLEEFQRRFPPGWDSSHPASRVLRTGAPLLFSELPDERIRTLAVDDEHVRLGRELGAESAMIVPLLARGQTLGAVSIVSATPGRYGRADLELAEEVARRAAIAIDNARLYRASQEAVRARSEFLTVASHELNTPVTSLMLALGALRKATPSGRPVDPQAMARLLEIAARQGVRLTRLVSDLLDVSRIEAGPLPLEVTDVDLSALVREVAERFEADLAQSRSSVSIQDSGQIVSRWDRSRIDQVVTNLLANAIKFGAGKPIEIVLGAEGGRARLAIHDHGIGIAPEQCDRIFGRFERAVSERHYGGLGLGLYICRRIVEEHGGSIRCASQPGSGTTFIVELPCVEPQVRAPSG